MLSYEVFGYTDSGCSRKENEDSVDWYLGKDQSMALAALADGMGGYFGGAIASHLAVKTVVKAVSTLDDSLESFPSLELERILLDAGAAANDAIVSARDKEDAFAEMGTTLIAVLALGNKLTVIHAGDSRCYRLTQQGQLLQMTRDDSIVQHMLDQGKLDAREQHRLPFGRMLTKSLGMQRKLRFSLQTCQALRGDTFLLCSDGLYHAVSENEIGKVLQKPGSCKKKVRELIDRSIANGAEGNVSAIVLGVSKRSSNQTF